MMHSPPDNLHLPRAATLATEVMRVALQPAAWAARLAAGAMQPPSVAFGPRLLARVAWAGASERFAAGVAGRHVGGEREPAAIELLFAGTSGSPPARGPSWPASPGAGPGLPRPVQGTRFALPRDVPLQRLPAAPATEGDPLLGDLAAQGWGVRLSPASFPLPEPAVPFDAAATAGPGASPAPFDAAATAGPGGAPGAYDAAATARHPTLPEATDLPSGRLDDAGGAARLQRTPEVANVPLGAPPAANTALPLAVLRPLLLRRAEQPDALARMGWSATGGGAPATLAWPTLALRRAALPAAGEMQRAPFATRAGMPAGSGSSSGEVTAPGPTVAGADLPPLARDAAPSGAAGDPPFSAGAAAAPASPDPGAEAVPPAGAPRPEAAGDRWPLPAPFGVAQRAPEVLRPAPFMLARELALRPTRMFPVARRAGAAAPPPGDAGRMREVAGAGVTRPEEGLPLWPLAPAPGAMAGLASAGFEPEEPSSGAERLPGDAGATSPSPAARFATLVLQRVTLPAPPPVTSGAVTPPQNVAADAGPVMRSPVVAPLEATAPAESLAEAWELAWPAAPTRDGLDVRRVVASPTRPPPPPPVWSFPDLDLAAPVQRSPALPEVAPPAQSGASDALAAMPAADSVQTAQPSVEELAQKVYDHLRRRLLIEHERRGRPL